jgi:hypothetical protein
MASETELNDCWDRVASQLRAYRQAQEQAWGEIDNATLGRFIADDLSREERQQIEQALDERPELRKLTDLVRDVLADFEPAVERAPAPSLPALPSQAGGAPRIIPFPPKQPGRPSVVRWVRQRSGMLAAACLLLVLSGALLNPDVGNALLSGDADAKAAPAPDASAFAMAPNGHQAFYGRPEKAAAGNAAGINRLEFINEKIDGLEQQGKWQEALALADTADTVARRAKLEQHPVYAANRERVAALSQQNGDLERACDNLTQAYEIRKKEMGAQDRETAKTAVSLANVYALAINLDGSEPHAKVAAALAPPPRLHVLLSSHTGPDPRFEEARKTAAELHDRLRKDEALKQQVVAVMVQGLENASTVRQREQFLRAITKLGPDTANTVLLQDVLKRQDAVKVRRDLLGIVVGPAPWTPAAFGD